MRKKDLIWLALFGLAALLTLAVKYLPFLPGDVSCARLVQSVAAGIQRMGQKVVLDSRNAFGPDIDKHYVSYFPGVAGWRAASLSVVSFMGLRLLGKGLGPIIAQPRPSNELVHVERLLSGSAFPSIFALNYISTVGFLAVLATVKTSGKLRWAILLACSLLLIIGWVARVALAAHWPSDVAITYLIGLLWVALLVRFA